ncbi:hypothetical protein BGX29_001962 [Mortierella sp. GBA35]|nr:hypothetical protein BGX29_001962 [Mortierella sp. GBA35]
MEINPAITFKHDRKVMHAKRPKVLIVGGGIGGLTLGMILQKTNIPYEIFERTSEIKPLGSAISLTCTTACMFKQMGIWEEFCSLTKEMTEIQVVNEKLETEFLIHDAEDPIKRYGADNRVIARPKLYELLLKQIPKERIHLGKKVQSTQQGGNGVLIRCTDGSEYEGDILVGADGAYSAVRQNLYAQLKKEKKLPSSDDVPLPFSTVCLIGQTRTLTTEEFPHLGLEQCQFFSVLGDSKPYAWNTLTTKQNTICWSVIQFLDEESSKENDSFRCSEWGSEAVEAMCKEVRDFPIVSGSEKALKIGDLIDLTPKEYISKVMLEEKVFKTWHHCRTVLIGDACHKLNPTGGAGAANAMHDAIVLSNYIHALPDHPVVDEIGDCFKKYREERISWVESAFTTSQAFRIMIGKSTNRRTMTTTTIASLPAEVIDIDMVLNRRHRDPIGDYSDDNASSDDEIVSGDNLGHGHDTPDDSDDNNSDHGHGSYSLDGPDDSDDDNFDDYSTSNNNPGDDSNRRKDLKRLFDSLGDGDSKIIRAKRRFGMSDDSSNEDQHSPVRQRCELSNDGTDNNNNDDEQIDQQRISIFRSIDDSLTDTSVDNQQLMAFDGLSNYSDEPDDSDDSNDSNDSENDNYFCNPILHERWHTCKKSVIEGGALEKYGRHVRNIKCEGYEMVELLATRIQACTGLLEFEVLSDPSYHPLNRPKNPNAPAILDLEPLITILQQTTSLRILKLSRRVLDEDNPDLGRVIDSIPESIERLELHWWDPISEDRRYFFQFQDQEHEGVDDDNIESSDVGTATPLARLQQLVFNGYAIDHNKQTLRRLLKRCPNVTTIRLEDASKIVRHKFLASLLSQHCPKLAHLHMPGWRGCIDGDMAALLDASQAGLRTLGFPRSWGDRNSFGPLSSAALLRNAATLGTLTIQQLFASAPNLKRFDAIAEDRSRECDCQLEVQDIVNGSDWVCTSLESLKIQIVGIPRPDIQKHMSGRPFGEHQINLHKGTMEASRDIQRQVYSQLGRLTKLKQLVLGHDDVERENGCHERESNSEGEYYDRCGAIESGHQYECLEMTLQSGMDLLKGLKDLRKIEHDAMSLGISTIEDHVWKREHWMSLDRRYKDRFWTRLWYSKYY